MISNASPEVILRIGLDEEGIACCYSAATRTENK